VYLHCSTFDRWRRSCKKLSALSPAWKWSSHMAKHTQGCSCSWSFLASRKREGRERKSKAGRRMVKDSKKRAGFRSGSLLFLYLTVFTRRGTFYISFHSHRGRDRCAQPLLTPEQRHYLFAPDCHLKLHLCELFLDCAPHSCSADSRQT